MRRPTDNQLVLAITLVGALLRLSALTTHSLWLDELQSVVTADPANSFREIDSICKASVDPTPVSFYYLLNVWFRITGYSDLTARLLPALSGVACIPMMYFLTRRL